MSRNPSACIPPPTDYTPNSKRHHSGKFRDRGARGGNSRGYRRGQGSRPTANRNEHQNEVADDVRLKNQPKDKFHYNEDDDYFAHVQEDDEEVGQEEELAKTKSEDDDDDEDDPLDAYMKSLEGNEGDPESKKKRTCSEASLDEESKKEESNFVSSSATAIEAEKKAVRLDIDETDDMEESYYEYVKQTRTKKSITSDQFDSENSEERQNLVEYDKDGNILSVKRVKREIEPLPPLDHSTINYEPFQRVFYNEHAEIQRLSKEQGEELRAKLEIKVSGDSPPKPVCSFAHFKFDEQLMKVIRRSEYTQPTPIQAQAIPAALLGRNIIGIAMTGSGKTAAYLWPMIVHIMGQSDLKRGDGPIALVLVPTRELALQVYGEAKKFSNSYRIAVVCAYGGGSKYEQSKDLEAGAEIVVATPGRLIDLIKLGSTNLRRVTYLVLDEADRFFEMGFEAQVRSICDQIRPDRQTLLFSATFKSRIEQLARTVSENQIKIVQKTLGEANEDVTQHVIVLQEGPKKWEWLTNKLVEFTSAGSVLVFVTRIINCEELHKNLKERGEDALLLHGDMEQSERNRVITSFKRKEKNIMIATDVAARGLDIAHVRTVINYDVARDIDTHVHRIGRTGRAGTKGDAYTLISEKDREFAGHLVKNLESSNQIVSEELMKLAMQSHNFRKTRAGSKHHRSSHSHRSHHHQQQHRYQHHRHHSGSSDRSQGEKNSSRYERHNYTHHQHYERSPHSAGSRPKGEGREDENKSETGQQGSTSYHENYRKRSRWY